MDYRGIIAIEPGKRSGQPCIRSLRVTVYDVLDYLAAGMTQAGTATTSPTSRSRTSAPAWPSPPTARHIISGATLKHPTAARGHRAARSGASYTQR